MKWHKNKKELSCGGNKWLKLGSSEAKFLPVVGYKFGQVSPWAGQIVSLRGDYQIQNNGSIRKVTKV